MAGEPSWADLTSRLIEGRDLDEADTAWAMNRVMDGEASDVELAGFLVALRIKGETTQELLGLSSAMLEHARRFEVAGDSVDIVGTGGDRMHTVNISTMAAIVVAACGVRVVKHGNRAASSSTGTADVLEELGVDLSLSPERVAAVADEVGITFCFAQAFHPSMRHAAAARKGLAVPTAFNSLGPLTNPAQPTFSAVGVGDRRMAPLIAGVFAGRRRSAAVFRGNDGLDELTTATTSSVWWVRDGDVHEFSITPTDVGLPLSPVSDLRGGDAAANAQVVRDLLAGTAGPVRDAVLLNAGMALAVVSGLSSTTQEGLLEAVAAGIDRGAQALDSGAGADLLASWVAATR